MLQLIVYFSSLHLHSDSNREKHLEKFGFCKQIGMRHEEQQCLHIELHRTIDRGKCVGRSHLILFFFKCRSEENEIMKSNITLYMFAHTLINYLTFHLGGEWNAIIATIN